MKPIAVFLTDTHKKKENLEFVLDIFRQSLKLAIDMKVKYVIHGGDFFNDRIGQNLSNLIMFKRILKEFKKHGITLVGIPGNHDKTDQESEDSYLSIYKSKYFKLLQKESIMDIEGVTFHFLPYFSLSMASRLEKLVAKIKDDKTILITHAGFNGVKNNDGSKVKEGLKKKLVKLYKKVFVGHYHDASVLGDNIFYTGSAYQANFGENIIDKGFTVIYDDCSHEFYPSKFKAFLKVKLDVDCDLETEIQAVEDMDANVRFIFEGSKSDRSKVNTKRLDQLGIDYKFEWGDINEEILKVESGEFGTIDKKSILKYFIEYCKIQEIPAEQKSFGLKLINS